ncbi:hypothetical protein [Cupriavidus campinensis]
MSSPSRRLACLLIAAVLAPLAGAQPMADSVVSRLVAWRARTDQPVTLAALTAFEWDTFSVVRAPAGDAMANCAREGLVPCGPELHPPAGTQVQVLRFDRAGRAVYQERIMVPSAYFADPLPSAVSRPRATLVTCADGTGRPLWCVQSDAAPNLRSPDSLDSLNGG